MMMISYRFYLSLLLAFCIGFVHAQESATQPMVRVSGEVLTPLELTLETLAKMERHTVTLAGRSGEERAFTGVAVQNILELAGVTTGAQLRGENLTKYLLVRCADGYEVVFSLAELDSSFTDRLVILADTLEGEPLPDGMGPFRMVVPGEKKPARSSFQVTEFVIRYAVD